MNEENITESQHYVPRLYLANFAVSSQKPDVLYCFDKYSGRIFLVNIKKVGCENWFYEIPSEPMNTVEKEFHDIEGGFKEPYEVIIDKKDPSALTKPQKEAMARFVVAQDLRTKEKREQIREQNRNIIEWAKKNGLKEESGQLWEQVKDYEASEEDKVREIQIDVTREARMLSEFLMSKSWIILLNKTEMPLWASDHPITRYNRSRNSPLGNNLGLNSPILTP